MLVTAQEIKQIDRFAIEKLGIPSLTLMERAAQHVTDTVLASLKEFYSPKIAVICGYGNNGGDGLACARQLLEAGASVTVILVGNPEKITPDAGTNLKRLQDVLKEKGTIQEIPLTASAFPKEKLAGVDCIVDALFGVGLSRKVEGIYERAIQAMNAVQTPVISVDIPSGLHSDTGEVMGTAVYAMQTVTFTAFKPGLLLGEGADYAGIVQCRDIGIPLDQAEAYLQSIEKTE